MACVWFMCDVIDVIFMVSLQFAVKKVIVEEEVAVTETCDSGQH